VCVSVFRFFKKDNLSKLGRFVKGMPTDEKICQAEIGVFNEKGK